MMNWLSEKEPDLFLVQVCHFFPLPPSGQSLSAFRSVRERCLSDEGAQPTSHGSQLVLDRTLLSESGSLNYSFSSSSCCSYQIPAVSLGHLASLQHNWFPCFVGCVCVRLCACTWVVPLLKHSWLPRRGIFIKHTWAEAQAFTPDH